MRFRAQTGFAVYRCRPSDPGGVVHCRRKDTFLLTIGDGHGAGDVGPAFASPGGQVGLEFAPVVIVGVQDGQDSARVAGGPALVQELS